MLADIVERAHLAVAPAHREEILAEQQPYTFLYVGEALPVVHKRFQGIEPAPAGISWNFHEWYVPASLQKSAIAQ